MASLMPEGANYNPRAWVHEPGQEYHYSVSAYPLLRYLVGQVSGQSYAEYMHENIFAPLEMTHSGFSADEFVGRHAIPHTRIDGKNIELPVWNGQGKRLYAVSWLPSPVRSHATGCGPTLGFGGFADLDGNGRADVPVAFGPWAFGARQNLFLMEAPDLPEAAQETAERDLR